MLYKVKKDIYGLILARFFTSAQTFHCKENFFSKGFLHIRNHFESSKASTCLLKEWQTEEMKLIDRLDDVLQIKITPHS